MQSFVDFMNGIIWSPALIYLCLGAGLFYSVITRFVQVRMFREMWNLLLSGKSSEHGISSFQALAVSLSGRVGTGNIAGVAAAIGFGGAVVGFAIAISGAASNSISIVDFATWGLIALIAQTLAFLVVRFVFMPRIVERIEANENSAGIMLGATNIAVGLLNAACMTY